jgi:uncharacterized protein (UPF0548 family)
VLAQPANSTIAKLRDGVSSQNFYWFRPTHARVGTYMDSQAGERLSYSHVGATQRTAPEGWDWHADRVRLGAGEACWDRAKGALETWCQFDLPWVFPHDRTVPIEVGNMFAFVSWQVGLWAVNVCRVVYTVSEEQGSVHRFGFAYGTVASHAVRGEEQFMLEWHRDTDDVFFYIRKFSKPRHWLVRAVGPLTRRIQVRFTRDALSRFRNEVTA